ncbi:MAG: hypothetical protein JWL59_3862 [Chthoniobacteraceae bacterium]|nr:hypothetical protein [Chthoniobacteraceae bacterium]
MSVHFRKGSAFLEVLLPDDLPDPHIRFRKGADAEVRTYAATLTPIRWLPLGSLKITCEQTVLSLVENVNYTGTLPMAIGFKRSGHGFLQKLGKTKTTTDE